MSDRTARSEAESGGPIEDDSATVAARTRDGHRLLQVGSLLFLLALLVGLAVPAFAVPRLGLSTHLLGLMQGTFLLAVGVVWPRLRLKRGPSRVGWVLGAYGCLVAWTANLLAAIWGAGNSMLPLAAGAARGSAVQEGIIRGMLVSAALALITSACLVVFGLRTTGGMAAKGSPR